MAIITNYATLKTAIADYLARDDLTTFIPNFVQAAERTLDRELNLRNEETALSVSVSSGTATVPTDFKALKFAYFDASPVQLLQWITIEELYNKYPVRTGAQTPRLIAREAANFTFGPFSKDGTVKGIYYAKKASLETTDPSWYVSNAPEALVHGALEEAAKFIQDDALAQRWGTAFTRDIDRLRRHNLDAEYSMGNLTQTRA